MKFATVFFLGCLFCFTAVSQSIEFNYVCPVPGSVYLNPSQVIILKTGYCFDPQSLKNCFAMIIGSQSGFILSKLSLSDDLKTLFVKPNNKFILGEKINVFISPGLRTAEGKNISSLNFDFFIKEKQISPIPMALTSNGESDPPVPADRQGENRVMSSRDNNLPPEYPAPTYVYTGPNAAPGYIFFTPTVRLTPQFDKYITIWDNYGTPIFYRKATKTVTDFRVLANGILTYAVNGMQNPENNCYYLMDSNYDVYDSVRAGYGYDIDNHDLLLLENGHYLILIYDPQIVNMSLIVPGGNPNAQVTGLVIQEVDLDRNVYFQWRSWDHFQITDATWDIDLTAYVIDYVHANALELDSDGNILVSCRHMDEVTKIDFNTGQIIWRWGLGAENNQFDFVNDQVGFSHQHDIRKLSNGNYTVYDNGNLHLTQVSRALEYHLDEDAMTATLVWSYHHDPVIYAPLTGGNQRLQNNNRLIGWGGTSPIAITEVNQQNQVMLELYLPDSVTGYRARKSPWQTTLFSMQNSLDFGNFNGSPDPKEYLLMVTNNYNQSIQISSAYNHEQDNFMAQGLPVTIPAGGTAEIHVLFIPDDEGTYNDILTLNYDNFNNTERIARQINLSGIWNPELPSIIFDPASGTEEIDPASEITATFSEPVRRIFNQVLEDDDVPNLFNFYTGNQDGETVSFHGTVNEDRTIITIIPDEVLDEQQQYYLRLKPNVLEDLNGNVMNYSDFCFFTTGELVNLWENNSEAQLHIFPNPANGMLVVESPGAQIKKVELFTPDGRLLFSGSSPDGSIRINTRDFPAGLKTINVTGSAQGIEWHHSSKIIITR
jgi:SAM-dependent methyltransferase